MQENMKVAFAYWDNRMAPVFDAARKILLLDVDGGRVTDESSVEIQGELPLEKMHELAALGIETLVCGAISWSLYAFIAAHGIHVIPFVTGELDCVIQAWLNNTIEREKFAMPGCFNRGRNRCRGMVQLNQESTIMNGMQGGGMGQGRRGKGKGQRGGALAGGVIGLCRCPQCGHVEPHERGVPCVQKRCPNCGSILTRE